MLAGLSGARHNLASRTIRERVIKKGVPAIDLRTPLLDKAEYFKDKVHPDRRGARVIAETMYTAITGRTPPGEESDQ